MELQQRSRRMGCAVIVMALLLRLYALGAVDRIAARLLQPNTLTLLTYLETGRYVRFSASSEEPHPHEAESAGPWLPPAALPVFSQEDAAGMKLYNTCSLHPDLERLIAEPLDWYLPLPEPTVLILHSHATESYTPSGEGYTESSAYRTLDEGYNMLSIGGRVAEILRENGIAVLHDRALHDHPDYSSAYSHARASIEDYLAAHPSIQLILDLHRDASGASGNELRTAADVNGQTAAQLMLVMGTNAGGLSHRNWEENLSLGLKLQAQLERQAPGIARPISLRSQRFNQDLSPGALLVEVGAAGNTHAEAMLAAEQLALAIVALAKGTG